MSKKPPKNFNALVKSLELVLKFRWLKVDCHSIRGIIGVFEGLGKRFIQKSVRRWDSAELGVGRVDKSHEDFGKARATDFFNKENGE